MQSMPSQRQTPVPVCNPDEILFMMPDEEAEVRASDAQDEVPLLHELADKFGGYLEEDKARAVAAGKGRKRRSVLPARGLDASNMEEAYRLFEQIDQDLRKRGSHVAWQPNWLTGAADSGGGKGSNAGPGARPMSFEPGKGQKSLPLRPAVLEALRGDIQDTTVRLIVLDGWNHEREETARLKAQYPLYHFLNDRCRGEYFELRDYFASRDPDPFPMPDHGLFAAYLAGEVIGQENLSLHDSILAGLSDEERAYLPREGTSPDGGHVILESWRVLDEYGVGDCLRLIEALDWIADSAQPGERIIVNMSLVMNTPEHQWLPCRFEKAFDGRWPGQARRKDSLDCVIYNAIRRLYDRGVLLVASTGNDSWGERRRYDSRLPAAYEEVVDVTAASHDGETEAWYANQATENGVALFAGDLDYKFARKGILDEDCPLVGPFTNSRVPVLGARNDPENETGHVAWAGTSFAAPLASGLAALLWLASPDQSPQEIAAALPALAKGRRLVSGTPFIDLFDFAS